MNDKIILPEEPKNGNSFCSGVVLGIIIGFTIGVLFHKILIQLLIN